MCHQVEHSSHCKQNDLGVASSRSYGTVYLQMAVTLKGINEVDATIQLRKLFS